jgi:biotin transport system substrate-specific component
MNRNRLFSMILIAFFTALTIIGTQITIPLAFVPITLQTLFVIGAGMMLGSLRGMLSQLLYVLIGLAGFPVFTRGQSGPQMVFTISFGYLIGFVVAPLVIGYILRLFGQVTMLSVLVAAFVGTIIIDLCGIGYILTIFSLISTTPMAVAKVFSTILLPTIPGDLVKVAILTFTIPYLYRVLNHQNLLPHKRMK